MNIKLSFIRLLFWGLFLIIFSDNLIAFDDKLMKLVFGVWNNKSTDEYAKQNPGGEPDPNRIFQTSIGQFYGYGGSILIDPYKTIPFFFSDGGGYRIIDLVEVEKNVILITVKGSVIGKVAMHFMQDGSVWFEGQSSETDMNILFGLSMIKFGPQNIYIPAIGLNEVKQTLP